MIRKTVLASLPVLCMATMSMAEPVFGLWASPPDGKGQTGHVEVSRCGDAICGKLTSAFDPSGKQIVTQNVGKTLFWDMKPAGPGKYSDGRVFVPIFGKDFAAHMKLEGTVLKVSGCTAGICKTQRWTRVR